MLDIITNKYLLSKYQEVEFGQKIYVNIPTHAISAKIASTLPCELKINSRI